MKHFLEVQVKSKKEHETYRRVKMMILEDKTKAKGEHNLELIDFEVLEWWE